MIATLERREGVSLWERFCAWITSTENRLYIGWFGCLFQFINRIKMLKFLTLSLLLVINLTTNIPDYYHTTEQIN